MTHISAKGVAALIKVAEWLEAGAQHVVVDQDANLKIGFFNMEYSVVANVDHDYGCGTACCIAGAVCQFERLGLGERDGDGDLDWISPVDFPSKPMSHEPQGAFYLAADYLGISYKDAQAMFIPFDVDFLEPDEYNDPEIAARVVRNFIETGVVDWNQACEDNYLSKK